MVRHLKYVFAFAVVFQAVPATAQNTQRGAVMGGLAGAIAGGIIGDHNDKAGAGAAIGGAIGALGGAVLGNAKDQEVRSYQYQAPQYRTQHYQVQQPVVVAQQAVSVADVIQMARTGLSDSVIINQIQQRGIQQRIQVPDIITLHQQGVSDTVITFMQQASVGAPPTTYIAPAPQTVIVEERYRAVPTYVAPTRVYYPAYPSHRHSHGHRW